TPCEEARARVAGAVARRPGGTGADDDDARGGRAVATALRSRDAKGSPDSDCTQTLIAFNPTAGTRDVQAGPLSPPLRVGSGLDIPSGPAIVAHTLRAEGYDASEDGTGRGTPLVAVPIQEVSKRTGKSTDDPRAGVGIGLANDPMYCLQAGAQHGVAFSINQRREGRLRDASHPNGGGQVAVVFNWQSGGDCRGLKPSPVVGALHVGQRPATMEGMQAIPRRLTPTECERLMGWPDGWTAWG